MNQAALEHLYVSMFWNDNHVIVRSNCDWMVKQMSSVSHFNQTMYV